MLMDDDENQNCLTCSHLEGKRRSQTPIFVATHDNSFENSPETTRKTLLFKKQTFNVGSAVMLLPDTFSKFLGQRGRLLVFDSLGRGELGEGTF